MDKILAPSAAVRPLVEKAAPPGKTWQRRKQARPGEILEAALTVFAEKGFSAARMEDIAAKAGVTKGRIYLYFESKEEVFKSLARQHVTDTLSKATDIAMLHKDSLRAMLVDLIEIVIDKLENSPMTILPKIIIAESGNFPELARFWRTEVIDRSLGLLSGVLAQAMERGELRKLPPDYVARLYVAPMIMGMIWKTVIGPTDAVPFDYRTFFTLHLDIMLNGLRPEGRNESEGHAA